MRFVSFVLIILFCFSSCKRSVKDVSEMLPEYKLIKDFSESLKKQNGLVLSSYGINISFKPCNVKHGVADFSVGYNLCKNRNEKITLEESRNLLIYVSENLLRVINSNQMVRPDLDVYPFTSDFINISIYFLDENKIELGSGVCHVYFSKGKIKYERYEIHEYRNTYPASGKHYLIHEETYKDAFDIVKGETHYGQVKAKNLRLHPHAWRGTDFLPHPQLHLNCL